MVDAETVRRRLRRLDGWVQRLRDLGARPRQEFLRDPTAQAAAERLLQVSIQIVLDIGAHILSDRGESTKPCSTTSTYSPSSRRTSFA